MYIDQVGIPFLREVWLHGPFVAAASFFWAVFGMMLIVQRIFDGQNPLHYRYNLSFGINDTIIYPTFLAVAATNLSEYKFGNNNVLSKSYFHYCVLAAGVLVALLLVWHERKIERFHPNYANSWMKAYHTLAFPVAFYWMIISFIGILCVPLPTRDIVIISLCVVGFLIISGMDGRIPGTYQLSRRYFYNYYYGAPRRWRKRK